MKKILLLSFILILVQVFAEIMAQSPYYSIKISMTDLVNPGNTNNYEFFHSLCTPLNAESKEDIFYHDTSAIDWNNLPVNFFDSIDCFKVSGTGTTFEYGNQWMVFNKIIYARIIKTNDVDSDTMELVFPVKIKSFLTFIDLTNIPFKKGVFNISNGLEYNIIPSGSMYLYIKLKENYEWKGLKKSNLIIKSMF